MRVLIRGIHSSLARRGRRAGAETEPAESILSWREVHDAMLRNGPFGRSHELDDVHTAQNIEFLSRAHALSTSSRDLLTRLCQSQTRSDRGRLFIELKDSMETDRKAYGKDSIDE